MKNKHYNSNNHAVINEFGVVQQVTNYYPFGGVFSANETVYAKSPDSQPYKYNGKEIDRTHGLLLQNSIESMGIAYENFGPRIQIKKNKGKVSIPNHNNHIHISIP